MSRHRLRARAARLAVLLGILLAGGCVHTTTSCGSSTVGLPGVVDLFHGAAGPAR